MAAQIVIPYYLFMSADIHMRWIAPTQNYLSHYVINRFMNLNSLL